MNSWLQTAATLKLACVLLFPVMVLLAWCCSRLTLPAFLSALTAHPHFQTFSGQGLPQGTAWGHALPGHGRLTSRGAVAADAARDAAQRAAGGLDAHPQGAATAVAPAAAPGAALREGARAGEGVAAGCRQGLNGQW